MLFALLLLHAVCGTIVLVGARRLGRRAWLIGGLAPAAVMAWVIANAGRITGDSRVTSSTEWAGSLGLSIDLRVDAFSTLMILLISGIGSLVFFYAWHYFGTSPNAGRAAGLLTLFAGAMLGIVLADNLLVLYVFWELTTVTSYLLIGLDDVQEEARRAARHALLITGLGGLVMLGGFVVLGQAAGTYRISEILTSPPDGTTVAVALVLILVGAFTKSAQYPFHGWLPAAMIAPTPISAYLHSAAMVKAGIYLVARLAPAFAGVGIWRPLVVTVGLFTMIAGGLRAFRPFDLKQLLAFGTISQLGFMMTLFGIGHPEATTAGCALILAHGLFKAALFMVVGIVDHETGTRDIRQLPLLNNGWGPTRLVAVVSAASMAAIPPLAGFIAKEEAYDALIGGSTGDRVVLAGIVAGSVLTVAYSLRFVAALVRPQLLGTLTGRPMATHHPSRAFVLPAAVLATGSVLLGVLPLAWSDIVDGAAHTLDAGAEAHLALWHGLTPALGLSALTLAIGAAFFWQRIPVGVIQRRLTFPVTGTRVYEATVRGVLELAGRVTSIVQSGSLPAYVAIILVTAAVAPTSAMLTGQWWPGWPGHVGNIAQLPVIAIVVTGALAATVATRRFASAILLGVVGYGMALLFVVQGAPDLALTQFGIETLSVVVFLLVLRVLPDRFAQRAPAVGTGLRLAVSAAVGIFVVLMAVGAAGSRTAEPISGKMAEQALPEGDGKNVVNVILVDIRGMDTLGEITVLVTAGLGVVALARAGKPSRRNQDHDLDDATSEEVATS